MDINISTFTCHNPECENFSIKNRGNILIKEYKGKNQNALLICTTCGKCFSETQNTPLFGLKTSIDELARTFSLIPKLGSIRAVAKYTKHKPDTILKWIQLVENNRELLNDFFFKYYRYTKTQIEEIWSSIESRKRKKYR